MQTFALDESEIPQGHFELWGLVFDAQSAAIATAHNGTVTSDVDKAARLIIELEDLGQYFTHRLGHGMYRCSCSLLFGCY